MKEILDFKIFVLRKMVDACRRYSNTFGTKWWTFFSTGVKSIVNRKRACEKKKRRINQDVALKMSNYIIISYKL